MQSHNSLKKEFLKNWIKGLQIINTSKENKTLLETKNAIKLSANLAMASTKKAKRHYWSRALIIKASKDTQTKSLAKQILQASNIKSNPSLSSKDDDPFLLKTTYTINKTTTIRARRGKNKLTSPRKYGPKKSNGASNSYNKVKKARAMAKRLVKKRTEILKGLIPGGEYLDNEYSLVKETLDYIVSLRAQVEVMLYLANSPHVPVQI